MGKVLKLNKSGTLGVSISEPMKAAGYSAGKIVEWVAQPNGFLLKLAALPHLQEGVESADNHAKEQEQQVEVEGVKDEGVKPG